MVGRAGGRSGTRSGLYSEQRFTNWTPHDPHWSEIEALPERLRPHERLALEDGDYLPIYERRLSSGFRRPWGTQDLLAVLTRVPQAFLAGVRGIYCMGGTAAQRRRQDLTFGMYTGSRIYLFPVPDDRFRSGWVAAANSAGLEKLRRLGAEVVAVDRRGARVVFDEQSFRRFYLYDVLLHELGHHVDQSGTGRAAERFAEWFADFQHVELRRSTDANS